MLFLMCTIHYESLVHTGTRTELESFTIIIGIIKLYM